MITHIFRISTRLLLILVITVASLGFARSDQPEQTFTCSGDSGEPIRLGYGGATSGCTISQPTDEDSFRFCGKQGDDVRINMLGSGDLDPLVEVRDPQFSVIASQTCSGGCCGCSFTLQFVLPVTGCYLIQVSDNGVNNTDDYTLGLERIPVFTCASPMAYNAPVSDTVNPPTDTDSFSFLGKAGTFIRLSVLGTGDLDPIVELRDPDGMTISTSTCSGGCCGCTFTVDSTINPLVKSGVYNLAFFDGGLNNTGGYQIGLSCLSANCPGNLYVTNLLMGADKQSLTWSPTGPLSTTYDVVKGSLGQLKSSMGNFAVAVSSCLTVRTSSPATVDASVPTPGEGIFYLARAVDGSGQPWPYDTAMASQICGRDAQILASPNRCAP